MKRVIFAHNPKRTIFPDEVQNGDNVFAIGHGGLYHLVKVRGGCGTSIQSHYNFVNVSDGNLWSYDTERAHKSNSVKALGDTFDVVIAENKQDILDLVKENM